MNEVSPSSTWHHYTNGVHQRRAQSALTNILCVSGRGILGTWIAPPPEHGTVFSVMFYNALREEWKTFFTLSEDTTVEMVRMDRDYNTGSEVGSLGGLLNKHIRIRSSYLSVEFRLKPGVPVVRPDLTRYERAEVV